jgi:uncharacterized protein
MNATNHHTERLQTIDIIRGIALFGILVINIQTYTLFAFLRPEQVYALQIDNPDTYAPVQYLLQLFIKGQFYTIFCFLFGLGFYLSMQKNKRRQVNGARTFKRRLWILLIVGLIHAYIFWLGDVLHKCAILGFSLLYFHNKSSSTIVKWIIGIACFVIVFRLIQSICFPATAESITLAGKHMDGLMMEFIQAWQHGTLLEVISFQKLGAAMNWLMSFRNGFADLAQFEIMFLLGLIAGKAQVFYHIPLYRKRLKQFAWRILPLAFLLKAIAAFSVLNIQFPFPGLQPYEQLIFSIAEFAGAPLLAMVYLVLITAALHKKSSRFLTWIGDTGRISLFNYLVQTLLCMVVFYGYAGGLSGRLSLLQTFIPVIAIYVFQVFYSNAWRKYQGAVGIKKQWKKMINKAEQPTVRTLNFENLETWWASFN